MSLLTELVFYWGTISTNISVLRTSAVCTAATGLLGRQLRCMIYELAVFRAVAQLFGSLGVIMTSSIFKICQYTIYGAIVLSGVGILTAFYASGTEHELIRRFGMSLFWSGGAIFLLAKGAGILLPIYLTMRVSGFRVPKEQRFSMSCWILGGAAMIFYGFLVLCLTWEGYFLHK